MCSRGTDRRRAWICKKAADTDGADMDGADTDGADTDGADTDGADCADIICRLGYGLLSRDELSTYDLGTRVARCGDVGDESLCREIAVGPVERRLVSREV